MVPAHNRCLGSLGFIFFVLFTVQIFNWLLNVTPHFNLPLGPELVIIGLCIIFLTYLSNRKSLRHPVSIPSFETITTSLLLAYMLLVTLRAFWTFRWRANPCLALWGSLPRLECIFQADINQDSSLRLWLYSVTALSLFILSRRLTLILAKSLIPAVILSSSSLFAMISLIATYYREKQFLPRYLILNEFGFKNMTHLMQNPSWVWPYLLPGLLCALYFAFANKSLLKKFVFFLIAALILWVMLASRQRGALLCIGVTLFLAVAGLVQSHWQQFKAWPWYVKTALIIFILSSVLPVVSYFYFPQELVSILNSVGLSTKLSAKNVLSVSRLNIWRSALSGMDGYWLTGHGYASWFEFFKPIAIKDGHRQIYDTAHNYFVQSVFELGLLQTLLLLGLFLGMIVQNVKRSVSRSRSLYMTIICTGSYLVVLSVQEVDFIRSAYYQHALFWGWLLTYDLRNMPPAEGECDRENPKHFYAFFPFLGIIITRLRLSFRGLGVLMMILGSGTVFWFSLAGYQFEADVTQGFHPKVRWLRSFGTLNAVQFRGEFGIYALYPVLNSTGAFIELQPSDNSSSIKFSYGKGKTQIPEKTYLPIRIRNPLALPDVLHAPTNGLNFGRDIALLTAWPPIYTRIPIVLGQNLHEWEALPGDRYKKIIWCKQTCNLQLLDCPPGQIRRLVIKGARPDISPLTPLITELSFSPLDFAATQSTETLSTEASTQGPSFNTDVELHPGRIIFSDREEIQFIDLEPKSTLTLSSQSVFSSQEDQRPLGVLLWDSYCHASP